MSTEVELKLALAPGDVARFRRHPLLKGIKATRRKLLSIYFDTPESDLFRLGVALRLRRVGYHWIQTLKAESAKAGALTARPEWETQVTGNRPDLDVLPPEALACLKGIDADQLQPCFSTEFTRTAWYLERDGNALELALDQGMVQAGDASEALSEVEFELKAGRTEFLHETALAFLEAVPMTLEPRSKAWRGARLAGINHQAPVRAARLRLHAARPALDAWQAMLDSALSQLVVNVPGTLHETDPEYLHQLRVAVRRLRTTLGLARDLGLARPDWEADLRWLMGELSPARDWDVFDTETLPRMRPRICHLADFDALSQAVAGRRAEATARARAALVSPRFVGMVLAAERMQQPDGAGSVSVSAWAEKVLTRRLKKLKKLGRGFSRLDSASRHEVRIAAKRLRYSAEAFQSLHSGRAKAYLKSLAGLLDGLGSANDLAVAHDLLASLDDARLAYARGILEGYMTAEAQARGAHLVQSWRAFVRAKPFWP